MSIETWSAVSHSQPVRKDGKTSSSNAMSSVDSLSASSVDSCAGGFAVSFSVLADVSFKSMCAAMDEWWRLWQQVLNRWNGLGILRLSQSIGRRFGIEFRGSNWNNYGGFGVTQYEESIHKIMAELFQRFLVSLCVLASFLHLPSKSTPNFCYVYVSTICRQCVMEPKWNSRIPCAVLFAKIQWQIKNLH